VDILETKVGGVVVLMPEGNLTAPSDCQALDNKLKSLLDGKTQQIVVDGSKVGQIGSGAMRVLLRVGRALGQGGGRLVLCALSERARLAFKISGFDNDFTIVSAQDRALVKVQEPAPPQPGTDGKGTAARKDPEAARREKLRALAAKTLAVGLKKVAWPSGAPKAPADGLRALASGLLEGGGA